MLVKEMREKLRMYRKEDLKPVSLMKKEEVARELEKYESKKGVEVREEDDVKKEVEGRGLTEGKDVKKEVAVKEADVKKEVVKKERKVKTEGKDVKERKVKVVDPAVEVKQEVEVVKKKADKPSKSA